MAASDIRQGRAGREDVGALIRGLRVMADAGVVNGPRDKAALRQAAGLLEKQAFQAGNQDKDWEGLLGEYAALRDRCRLLEEMLEEQRVLKPRLEDVRRISVGPIESGYDQMLRDGYPHQRVGIDFEAPAPVTW